MSKTILSQKFQQSLIHQNLSAAISKSKEKIHLKGALGSSLSFTIASLFKTKTHPFLLIFNNKEEAAYYLNDLEVLLDDKEVLFYPGSYRRPYQIEETDNANVLLRAEVLNRINSQKKPALIVTYPEALFEKVLSRKELEKSTFKVAVGEELNLDFFNEVLFDYQFTRVDFVTEPGEFSVRGGIVDVFSFSHDEPYRIEFFGDEVDSIRTFDIESQLSIKPIKKLQIIPNIEHKLLNETRQGFLEYISSNTVVFTKNIPAFLAATDTLQEKASEAYNELSTDIKHSRPEDLFCTSADFKSQLLDFTVVEFGSAAVLAPKKEQQLELQVSPQPSFNKQFNLIIEDLNSHHDLGYQNFICCSNTQQAQRFYDIFETVDEDVHCQTIVMSLYQGFIDHDKKIVCYTDHQIFERYHKFHLKNGF
ncbi:transcription-repair coupling factor, partial [Flavobacteriaceae bacterium]|nr:transcription-repair coupling factor [Flavobacteriaceae bacterium]